MKNERIYQWVLIVFFICFIAVFALLFWVLPKQDMSELERRKLSDAPKLSVNELFSGNFGKAAETYLSDHFPARSTWVGIYAYTERLSGRTDQNGIYLGANDRLYVAPTTVDESVIDHNCAALTDFVDKTGLHASYMIVPSVGALDPEGLPTLHAPYRDDEILAHIDEQLSGFTKIKPILTASHFYRTDHHWTSEGAYQAYLACADILGFAPLESSAFTKESIEDFYGTSYAKAGFWSIAPDTMELWHSNTTLSVEIQDSVMPVPITYNSVFFRDALDTMDKYTVYLDGNHARVRLINETQQGKLLVVKDSFAHTLVPFLAEHYGQIDMIDLRHFRRMPVSEFAAQEGYTDVLFVYGIDTVAASNDLLWLQ